MTNRPNSTRTYNGKTYRLTAIGRPPRNGEYYAFGNDEGRVIFSFVSAAYHCEPPEDYFVYEQVDEAPVAPPACRKSHNPESRTTVDKRKKVATVTLKLTPEEFTILRNVAYAGYTDRTPNPLTFLLNNAPYRRVDCGRITAAATHDFCRKIWESTPVSVCGSEAP